MIHIRPDGRRVTKADHLYQRDRGHKAPGAPCSLCGRHVSEHPSRLERDFDAAVLAAGLQDGMVRELAFARDRLGRQWRFDRAWPALLIAVELDGGVRMAQGGHTTQADRDKFNAAGLLGWQVLTFEPYHLRLGLTVAQLRAAIAIRQAAPAQRQLMRVALRPEWFPTASERKAALQEVRRRGGVSQRISRRSDPPRTP